jgi:diacylglycerol kinase (ATP)
MKSRTLTDKLNNAVDGIIYAFRNEWSLKAHFAVTMGVLIVALLLDLKKEELLLVFFAISLVIMAEMFNTAMEAVVNLMTLAHHPLAKIAKDVAAGGVFVACLNALAVGYLVLFLAMRKAPFLRVFENIREHYIHGLMIMLIALLIFIIIGKALGRHGRFTKGGLVSGHAAFAFGASTAILLITKNMLATSLAFLIAVLVAHSRIEAHAHKWVEVVLGALLGIFMSLAIFQLFYIS